MIPNKKRQFYVFLVVYQHLPTQNYDLNNFITFLKQQSSVCNGECWNAYANVKIIVFRII